MVSATVVKSVVKPLLCHSMVSATVVKPLLCHSMVSATVVKPLLCPNTGSVGAADLTNRFYLQCTRLVFHPLEMYSIRVAQLSVCINIFQTADKMESAGIKPLDNPQSTGKPQIPSGSLPVK